MRFDGTRSIRRGALFLFSTVGLCLSGVTVAQAARKGDDQGDKSDNKEEPAGATAAAQNAETAPPAERQAGAAPATVPDMEEKLSYVEHLPGSAFPDPPRGLYGGSVWLNTFHGLQWPYIPRTGIGISGSAWVDTGYEKITRGGNHPDTLYWLQQGRAVLRMTPTYTHGRLFVQGQAELVANKDQTVVQPAIADTDDLWVRFGIWKQWDLQAGRFEAWEIYHLGMGLDLNTLERRGAVDTSLGSPPDFYGVTNAFYRPSGVGNLAFHVYPADFLRFEALGQAGNESGYNALGGRGAGILDFGWLRLKAGAEYRKTTPVNGDVIPLLDAMGNQVNDANGMPIQVKVTLQERKIERGYGAGIILMLYPILEGGFNVAQGLTDRWDRSGAPMGQDSFTVTSFGGFANLRPVEDVLVGVGADYTVKDDTHLDNKGKVGHFKNLQAFGALQYLVAKQLFVKAVVAYAKASFDPSFDPDGMDVNFNNTMVSARLRLLYLF